MTERLADVLPGDAQTWGAMGIWALLAIAIYCAVCETMNMLAHHGLRKDFDEYMDRTDDAIDTIHKRLENLKAPGPHVETRDVTILSGPVIDPTKATTVHEAVKATNQAVQGLEQMAASIKSSPDDQPQRITSLPPAPKPSGSHRWEPAMDKPTTEQQQEPTRPDFARLRDISGTDVPDSAIDTGPETDPLAPVFVQPGDNLSPAPKTGGRHRAEP